MADFNDNYDSGSDSDDEVQKGVQEEIQHNVKNRKGLLSKTLKKAFSVNYSRLCANLKRDLINFEIIGKEPVRGCTQFTLTKFYEVQNLNKKMDRSPANLDERDGEDNTFDDRVYKMKFHFNLKNKIYIWDNESGKWSCEDVKEKELVSHPEFTDFYCWTDKVVPHSDSVNSWEYAGTKWIKVLSDNQLPEVHLSKADYAKAYCSVFEDKVVTDFNKYMNKFGFL
jgi:hypothetical protein